MNEQKFLKVQAWSWGVGVALILALTILPGFYRVQAHDLPQWVYDQMKQGGQPAVRLTLVSREKTEIGGSGVMETAILRDNTTYDLIYLSWWSGEPTSLTSVIRPATPANLTAEK